MRFETRKNAESYRKCRHTDAYADALHTVKYFCLINQRTFYTVVQKVGKKGCKR